MNWRKFLRRTTAAVLIGAFVLTASVVFAATPQEEIQQYTQQIQNNPNNAVSYLNRGLAYRHLNQYERAITDYTKAIQLNPNFAEAYYNRGKAYQALGNTASAQADFARARELGYKG